ncbi:MAG: hypothetical protein V1790_08795, partial [Planctomycetota bacterium]
MLAGFDGGDPAVVTFKAYTALKEKRWRIHQKWVIVLNMLAGEQWLRWNPRSRILDRLSDMVDDKLGGNMLRAVDNRLLPAYDSKLGRLCQVTHIPESVPVPGRKDAFELARIESRYLEALWWMQNLRQLDVRSKAHVVAFGLSWYEVDWDEAAVERQMPSIYVHSPFTIMPYPFGPGRVSECDGVIKVRAVAVEVLRKQYPKAFDEDDAELKAELEEDYDMMLAGTDSVLMQTGHTR